MRVKNIFIFVADALRWDYLPAEIQDMGLTFKTVAQSIWTPVSFASIVTGLNPPRHRVFDFTDRIQEVPSLFDLPLETSYWAPTSDSLLYSVFNNPERIPLEDIPEPFIYMYHSRLPHAPYDPSFKGTARDYMRKFGRNKSRLRSDYKRAVDIVCKEFLDNVHVLKRRGILDRTLIVFTSDHGEILALCPIYSLRARKRSMFPRSL